ncbi:hypothetical protein Vafri_12156 [Volvox africanus]|uniref:Uncharacterized protein n=1 Tax=Volvox africanus TaxID=51714 RepID=A0A8J4B9J4_9CHLO|nr:hypothetical protein Vafri_12156 [Volvox africanus]
MEVTTSAIHAKERRLYGSLGHRLTPPSGCDSGDRPPTPPRDAMGECVCADVGAPAERWRRSRQWEGTSKVVVTVPPDAVFMCAPPPYAWTRDLYRTDYDLFATI